VVTSSSYLAEGWDSPVCGITWGFTGVRGTWSTTAAEESMAALTELQPNWVTLAYSAWQSTVIAFTDPPTLTDDEIVGAVRRAQAMGLRICLKPMVNVADGTWRAYIGFFDWEVPGEPSWSEWFACYREYLLHHARLAAELEVDLLCIGCEMVRADSEEAHWRALIADIRAIYGGLLTYNCDKYQEDHVSFWDALDVISSSGYYPSGEWETQLDRIEAVVRRADKPFCFLEAGCPSREGAPARPNDWTLVGARPAKRPRPIGWTKCSPPAPAAPGSAVSCSGTGRQRCTTGPTPDRTMATACTARRGPTWSPVITLLRSSCRVSGPPTGRSEPVRPEIVDPQIIDLHHGEGLVQIDGPSMRILVPYHLAVA